MKQKIRKIVSYIKKRTKELISAVLGLYALLMLISVAGSLLTQDIAAKLGEIGITLSVGILGLSILALPFSFGKFGYGQSQRPILEKQLDVIGQFTIVLAASIALMISSYLPNSYQWNLWLEEPITKGNLLALSMIVFVVTTTFGVLSLFKLVEEVKKSYGIGEEE